MRHYKTMLIVLLALGSGCRSSEPDGEDQYEKKQTERNLGVKVEYFPAPDGIYNFCPLGKDLPEVAFEMAEQRISMPRPRESFERVKTVKAKTADDLEEYEAMNTSSWDKELTEGHGFKTGLENRRHHYRNKFNFAYYGFDIFVGQREDGKLKPLLFFRDVGQHTTKPHHIAMDNQGHCHLVVTDVNTERGSIFKLYWAIGDAKKKKWLKAWLVHYRKNHNTSEEINLLRWKDNLYCAWMVEGKTRDDGEGLYYLEKNNKGFGRKYLILKGQVEHFDMAVDPDSGRLVLVFAPEGWKGPEWKAGLRMMAKLPNQEWSKPVWLIKEAKDNGVISFSLKALGKGEFALRAAWALISSGKEFDKQFLIKNIQLPKGKRGGD